ncbi:MAG TPA: Gfo/Idh/MocA family oxidoreductase [Chitinophagaceae bacterium]|nr:Gfo/Idh/MocA family oxidoreductase [Chitinophagaceae bacterium]
MIDKKKNTLAGNSRRHFIKQSATALAGFIIVPRFVLGGNRPDGSKYISPSDMINLGFIGCGKQGRILSNYFLSTSEIRIVAVSEVYKDKTELMLKTIKSNQERNKQTVNTDDIGVYTDFRELLSRKNIDAVVIATPDHWHAAVAVRAAEAGKDIYCEKPLSLTVKEGRAMVKATRKHNRVFQTGSMQRSWPEFRQAVEIVRNGFIGEIKNIKVNVGPPPIAYNLPEQPVPDGLDWSKWLGPNEFKSFNAELAPPITKDVYPNWRNYKEFGGGMVTDWGAHMFDIAQWALDMDESGPVEIFAPDAEHPFLTYRYKNNIMMTHEKWEWNNAVLFTGTEGEIRIGRGRLETTPASVKNITIGDTHKHVYKSENHYKDFLNAMRTRTKPICDVETGHRTATVCNIGNIAYQVKRPLKWDPKTETIKKDTEANALLGRLMLNEWAIKI